MSDRILARRNQDVKTRKMIARTLAIAGALTLAGTANASSTFIAADNTGTPLAIFGVTGFTVTGAAMAGLHVIVTFSDLSVSDVFWGAVTSGQAQGASPNDPTHGWILAESGDTGAVSGPTI